MRTDMIERRLTDTRDRIYKLQAERVELARKAAELAGTEDDCAIAGAVAMAADVDYLRALESYVIDAEFLRTGGGRRSAA